MRIRSLTPWPAMLAFTACALAGDLNPPPGPVDSSFRTLDQICPGVPISTLPGSNEASHIIQLQGRFILDADVIGQAGKHGILIDNPGGPVVIEGNGFSIRGVPGSLDAVHAQNARGITIATTHIESWDGDGVDVVMEEVAFYFTKISFTRMSVSQVGGNGIRISPPTGVPEHGLEVRLEDVSMAGIGNRGISILQGGTGNSINLAIRDAYFEDGGDTAINVDPPLSSPAPGRTYLQYKLDRCLVKSWSTAGNADGVIFPSFSAGSIAHTVVEDVGGDGIRVADDAYLMDVQVMNTGGDGVVVADRARLEFLRLLDVGGNGVNAGDEARVGLANIVDSGAVGILAGDNLTISNSTIGGSGGHGVFSGKYLVTSATHIYGAVSTGRGARVSGCLLSTDMGLPAYAPHLFVGGEHNIEHSEFRVLGNDPMLLPTVIVEGDESSIKHSKFLMQDTPIDPVSAAANRGMGVQAVIELDGDGCEFRGNTIAHIWSPITGLALANGRSHFVIQDNNFIGARGLGAVGILGVVDDSIVTGNTFSGLGPSGLAFDLPGTGNVLGSMVDQMSIGANASPDRNLVVP